ncbi:MAG: hypothetical protein P9M02_05920 [Candidatus Susulua stagnicola]|nr:hypothetical protein [Candidatus Susulua stagnicola]
MNYREFTNKFQGLPIIISKDVVRAEEDNQVVRNQLNRWQKKGLIIKLKRGVYLFNKNDRRIDPSLVFVANQLYAPSYVSLEFALNYYGLIPERVADLTCISTKKTIRFENELGLFIYQHVKPGAFRGFRLSKDEYGMPLLFAEPEKAVVDFLYFNLNKFKSDSEKQFKDSYRFQNIESLKQKRLIELARHFENKKLMRLIESFSNFITSEVK